MIDRVVCGGVFILLIASLACLSSLSAADSSASPAPVGAKLVIEPSSSSLAGGTAKLAVDPLSRSGLNYVGEYQIQVIPYFFKNENGHLVIEVSDSQLRQMEDGTVTSFVGEAKANTSEQKHKISAKATPADGSSGALIFTVATDSGPLIFNTSYRILRE